MCFYNLTGDTSARGIKPRFDWGAPLSFRHNNLIHHTHIYAAYLYSINSFYIFPRISFYRKVIYLQYCGFCLLFLRKFQKCIYHTILDRNTKTLLKTGDSLPIGLNLLLYKAYNNQNCKKCKQCFPHHLFGFVVRHLLPTIQN